MVLLSRSRLGVIWPSSGGAAYVRPEFCKAQSFGIREIHDSAAGGGWHWSKLRATTHHCRDVTPVGWCTQGCHAELREFQTERQLTYRPLPRLPHEDHSDRHPTAHARYETRDGTHRRSCCVRARCVAACEYGCSGRNSGLRGVGLLEIRGRT